jgi:hypothetical protein
MAKARVYELAKELGVGNKEILEQLKKKNVEVKNHMSTVEDNVAEEIRRENSGIMSNSHIKSLCRLKTHFIIIQQIIYQFRSRTCIRHNIIDICKRLIAHMMVNARSLL